MRHRLTPIALALGLLLAGMTGSASADFTRIETVVAHSVHDSQAKSVTVNCPAGKRVVGAGAYAAGSAMYEEHVLIDAVRPGPQLGSVTVRAREDEVGSSGDWVVWVLARCAPAPAGLQRIAATSASSSAGKSAVAVCPGGKRLLGTGAETTGAAGQILLDGLLPDAALTRTTANALEDRTGTSQSWTITAYAICANPVRGLERVAATAERNASPSRGVTANCSTGKTLVGAGATIDRVIGPAYLYVIDLAERAMSIGAFLHANATPSDWGVTGYAICAAQAHRTSQTTPSSAPFPLPKTNSAPCPQGMNATGAGGEMNGALAEGWLRDLYSSGTSAHVHGATSKQSGPWSLAAHAVCATQFASATLESASSAFDAGRAKTVTVTCPAGTRVLGAGAEAINPGTSEEHYIVMEGLRPDLALTSVTATAQMAPEAITISWILEARAICAVPPSGLQRVAATTPATSDELVIATATCPGGKHLIGTGAEIAGGGGYAGFDDIQPDAGLTRNRVIATQDDSLSLTNWSATAYAICINR